LVFRPESLVTYAPKEVVNWPVSSGVEMANGNLYLVEEGMRVYKVVGETGEMRQLLYDRGKPAYIAAQSCFQNKMRLPWLPHVKFTGRVK
jgi:hypothetical protein